MVRARPPHPRSIDTFFVPNTNLQDVDRVSTASGALGAGRSLPLAVLTRRLDPDRHPGNLWPVAVNRLLASAGHPEHLALDYAPDFFQLTIAREEEDAALPTPQLRDLAVADEDRGRVRVVRAELESVPSPVEEQDFLRQIESDARSPVVLVVEYHQVAWREPLLDGSC